MRRRSRLPVVLTTVWSVTLLLAVPRAGRATAGFAETHSVLRYTDAADLEWRHPGDGCDEGDYCFHLVKVGRTGWFRNLYGSLDRISVPSDSRCPFVLAQLSQGKRWIVYDLGREETVVDTGSYDEALSAWRFAGQPPPVISEARSAHGLHETWSSLLGNWAFMLLLWSPLLAILSIPVLSVASLRFWSRFRAARRALDLVLCGLCALPVAAFILLVLRVLAVIVMPRPGR
jgi:hypothetical protein